jgi:hypothetical protein
MIDEGRVYMLLVADYLINPLHDLGEYSRHAIVLYVEAAYLNLDFVIVFFDPVYCDNLCLMSQLCSQAQIANIYCKAKSPHLYSHSHQLNISTLLFPLMAYRLVRYSF